MNQDFEIINGELLDYFGKDKEVTVPDSVTSIGERAFDWHKELESVGIPESVTSIGDFAFCGCNNLKEITLPEHLTGIGERAFYYCTNLKEIRLPEQVQNIGKLAFWHTGLIQISVPEQNQYYTCCDKILYDKNKKIILKCLSDQNRIRLPESIVTIGDGAFSHCKHLLEISIPEGVTSIGDMAFECCTVLKRIRIPEHVTYIGNYAFEDCWGLKEITIPESVENIGNDIFYDCKNLLAVTILNVKFQIGNYNKYYDFYDEFESEGYYDITRRVIPELLVNGEFEPEYMPETMKYSCIFQILRNGVYSRKFLEMTEQHLVEIMEYLMTDYEEQDKSELVQRLQSLITKENIDDLIRYAIDHQKHEIQLMLTDYKNQKNWYQNIDQKLKL